MMPIAKLQLALPECNIVNHRKVAVKGDKKNIDKPFEQFDIPVQTRKVSGTEASKVIFSSARLDIPENAFVDKNGKLITTPVQLDYKEYMNPAQIMLSGIPMSYDSAGVQYNFSSAGMFELNASTSNGDPVFPNPENPITVELASSSADTDFNLYAFDTASGQWQVLGKDEVRMDLKREKMIVDLAKLDSLKTLEYFNKVRRFKRMIEGNRVLHRKVQTVIKRERSSGSFSIAFDILPSTKTSRLVESVSNIRGLQKHKWVYDGDNREVTEEFLKEVSSRMKMSYKRTRLRGGVYSYSGPSYIRDISLKPSSDGSNFLLSFKYKDSLINLNVYPKLDDHSSRFQVKKNLKTLANYKRRHRVMIRKGIYQRNKLNRSYRKIRREMRSAGITETIAELEALEIK